MKPISKVAVVFGGYLLAFLMAWAAVALHMSLTNALNPQGSGGGMSAFGDLILFVVIFGMVALVPTGAAVFFLFSKKKKPAPALQQAPTGGATDL